MPTTITTDEKKFTVTFSATAEKATKAIETMKPRPPPPSPQDGDEGHAQGDAGRQAVMKAIAMKAMKATKAMTTTKRWTGTERSEAEKKLLAMYKQRARRAAYKQRAEKLLAMKYPKAKAMQAYT